MTWRGNARSRFFEQEANESSAWASLSGLVAATDRPAFTPFLSFERRTSRRPVIPDYSGRGAIPFIPEIPQDK